MRDIAFSVRPVHRLDRNELIEAFVVAPGEEPPARVETGRAGVRVLDRDREEFDIPARGLVAGGGDDSRHYLAAVMGGDGPIFGDDKGGRCRPDRCRLPAALAAPSALASLCDRHGLGQGVDDDVGRAAASFAGRRDRAHAVLAHGGQGHWRAGLLRMAGAPIARAQL
jgi:hypothetical protein